MTGMYRNLKKQVFAIIQPAEKGNLASKIFDLFIMVLIFITIASIFLVTFDFPPQLEQELDRIEKWAVVAFTAEYLLRIWTADLLHPELGPWRARVKYVFSGMALIDLAAILPYYLPMLIPINLVGIRAVRLVRVLRIFKLNRYSEALNSICEVFQKKMHEILAALFFVMLLLIIASLLIYYAEHDAQPDKFPNAFSGLWWAVATLTTVGYGDIYPITAVGRFLGAAIAIMGIGMVAVPTGILSAGFVEVLEKKNQHENDADEPPNFCPHCGKKLR